MNYVFLTIIIILLLLLGFTMVKYEKFNDWSVNTEFPEGAEDSYSVETDSSEEDKQNYLASRGNQWNQNDIKNEQNYQLQKKRKTEVDNIRKNKLNLVNNEQNQLNKQLSTENSVLNSQRIYQKNKLINDYIKINDNKIRIEKRRLGAFNKQKADNVYKNNTNYSVNNNIFENNLKPNIIDNKNWNDKFTKLSSGRYYLRTFSEKELGDSFYEENKLNDENSICNTNVYKK